MPPLLPTTPRAAVALLLLLGACAPAPARGPGAGTTETRSSPAASDEEAAFRARADALVAWLADAYVPPGTGGELSVPQPVRGVPDPQKYIWPKVIARLRQDPEDRWARAAVAQFWDRGETPSRHDASFYHFAAMGLARLLFEFPDAVAPHREALLRRAMQEEQLFSAAGTENHLAMWRTSGYLFAQEAGDARRLAESRAWLLDYADRLHRLGKGEWDSSTYAAFDIASWLNVADFARDPEVRARAREVVDLLAVSLALKWVDGGFGGAEKRGFSGAAHESIGAYLAWLWFADAATLPREGFFAGSAIYTLIPALSPYRPSAATLALARKRGWTAPESYRLAKPNYAMTEASQAREVLYATPEYVVGASVASPIGGWGGGDTQETLWKMVAAGDGRGGAGFVIGGAGASYARRARYSGGGRGPWDQVAQHRDVVLQMTRVPVDAERLTREARALFDEWRRIEGNPHVSWAEPSAEPWAYARLPAGATVVEEGGVLFLDMGGRAFAAVRPLNGRYAAVTEGVPAGSRVIRTEGALGELVGFAYEFGGAGTDGSFAAFRAAVSARSRLRVPPQPTDEATYVGRDGTTFRARFGRSGSYVQPEYDWGPQPRWPSGEGHGRVPRIWVDGVELDLRSPWPVFEGPRLRLDGGALWVSGPDGGRPGAPGTADG